MHEKLSLYIQSLKDKKVSLLNQSADFALTSVVHRHNSNEAESNKFYLSSLINFYQNQLIDSIIKDLGGILELNVGEKTNTTTSKVIDVGGL